MRKIFTDNNILLTDSYKISHWKQYPPHTEGVYSYLESRGGEYPYSVFFGLQYILNNYLETSITKEDINQAAYVAKHHFGNEDLFNIKDWVYILEQYQGKLPVEIKAVPEGTKVPTGNVLMTIENTDRHVPWITNYLETILMQVWYPTTVCTQSHFMKKYLLKYLNLNGNPDLIDYKLHDFGFRGSTSIESSAIGGAAHLVNFRGTDTLSAVLLAARFYHCDMAGHSIPAAEHSTITSWGVDKEQTAYENMLNAYPSGLVAVVSDSYNIYDACETIWGTNLKDKVLARDGCLVIRPDSGDPHVVLPKIMEILGDKFGFTTNQKGFKVLNDKVRVIQGDGIDANSLVTILEHLHNENWSADNIAFGSGGGLLQKVNRDTMKFAIKCSAVKIGGQWQDVYKNPITDPGKASKRGKLKLILNENGGYNTLIGDDDNKFEDQLEVVYRNGLVMKWHTMNEIRARADS